MLVARKPPHTVSFVLHDVISLIILHVYPNFDNIVP